MMTLHQKGGTVGKHCITDSMRRMSVAVNGQKSTVLPTVPHLEDEARSDTLLFPFSGKEQQQIPDHFKMDLKLYARNIKDPFKSITLRSFTYTSYQKASWL
ncbi:hypothetical protein [Paenibacillus donghaensis]|uniref:Uncharacterized protein n=1 Tax=Paenibacillus donghaensis TaxID=414771 RepID=A0A2Z2KNU1_9BACL|nr:hypothetical protein [Paenibacillus donghaensis]ASA25303.1 hypothetical protein B9T62_33970 [Paenibacillus donghaensis]